eukprot:jgi/Ulvmu1/10322/UM061_0005.1
MPPSCCHSRIRPREGCEACPMRTRTVERAATCMTYNQLSAELCTPHDSQGSDTGVNTSKPIASQMVNHKPRNYCCYTETIAETIAAGRHLNAEHTLRLVLCYADNRSAQDWTVLLHRASCCIASYQNLYQ